jgi:transcriptional regulator with XRE-family HTH domain
MASKKALSLRKLAEQTRISRNQISAFRRGKADLSVAQLTRIGTALSVPKEVEAAGARRRLGQCRSPHPLSEPEAACFNFLLCAKSITTEFRVP